MGKKLWEPSKEQIEKSNMYRFLGFINKKYNQNFTAYDPLYHWSVNNIPDFWAAMWEFAEIKASKTYDQVIEDVTKMPGAKWFPGAQLNFAENLLRYRDDHVALIFKGEGLDTILMTYAELYREVARFAKSLSYRSGRQETAVRPQWVTDSDTSETRCHQSVGGLV